MSIQLSNKKINFQLLISYLGIFPFIFIFIDICFFHFFLIKVLKDFAIFYSLIIFTFIGSMRWNYQNDSSFYKVIYGFLPSLISVFLIILYLVEINNLIILLFILNFLFIQLIFDYFFYKINSSEKFFFFYVRLPITFILLLNILYLIFV